MDENNFDDALGSENPVEWSAEKFDGMNDFIRRQTIKNNMQVEYVPQTLEEAEIFLEKFIQDRTVFQETPEDEATANAHHSIGRWIRNRWHFWWNKETAKTVKDYPEQMPALTKYFKDLGVFHPDDMSALVILSLHRKLNNVPFDLDVEVEKIKQFYKENGDENIGADLG